MNIFRNKYNFFEKQSDGELISIYKKNSNPEIIGIFYERYHHLVFGVCLKYMKNADKANEALFDVYSLLYEYIKRYTINDFKSWLFAVVRNHCLSQLKKYSKEVELSPYVQNSANRFMEKDQELTHKIETEQKIELMAKAIKKLKPEQKQCIELFFLKEKSYAEIVEITKFDIKKVKSYIQNGKRNLQIIMEKEQTT